MTTEVCIIPPKQSLAQGTKFSLSFDRISNTIFQCVKVNIPGLLLPNQTQPTPFVNLPVPGNKMEFEPLNITFLIDSQYNSWFDIFNWITGDGFPENFEQYANLSANATRRPGAPPSIGVRPPYSDATLILYTNKNNPQIQLNFHDCFPVSLSSIDLSTEMNADIILNATASFRYSYYQSQAV